MKALENTAVHTELGAASAGKDPASLKRRGVLRGGIGFLVPFVAGLPFIAKGAIPITWGEWLFALSAAVAMWSLLWCILALANA